MCVTYINRTSLSTLSIASILLLSACGGGGSSGGSTTPTQTTPIADTSSPNVSFNPATLSVQSEQMGTSTLSATDNRGVTSGPTVSCTNGGTFTVSTNTFTAAAVTADTTSLCTATAGDAAGNTGSATLTVTMTPAQPTSTVTLSGRLTYDRVPFPTASNGLDYDATFRQPIRQVPVELLDASGNVLDSTVSDDRGDYSFSVNSGENVRVRVRSEVQKTAPNLVDLQVVDNTSGNALYALQSSLSVVPATDQTRNLRARSGWGGSSYTGTRAAAPFALLDTIYSTLEAFIEVDPDVDFPAFDVLWSTRNRAESGSVADGQIGTSSFTVSNGVPVIRILGDANNDTDEYDAHVVVHEFGHYFENSLSRADSIGGQHSTDSRLDARVAFGEGWGNALSGMILDDPIYRDSFGVSQASSFGINVETNSFASTGWYSEASVQSILYDLYDSVDDGADIASFGLGPIYGAFTDPAYRATDAFTTIFAFLDGLSNQPGVVASEVEALTDAQLISGSGQFGVGETNSGDIADMLPVYLTLFPNNNPVEFCSRNIFGEFNKHGNRRYFAFNAVTAGDYRFTVTRLSGATNTDPDFVVFKNGDFVGVGESQENNSEVQTIALTAGRHVIDAYDFNNIGGPLGANTTPADSCFTMTLEAL